MWWTIFVRNGGKAHIDQLLLTNLNYEWQGNSERARERFTALHRPPRCLSLLKSLSGLGIGLAIATDDF
jgi:hypothetical protein